MFYNVEIDIEQTIASYGYSPVDLPDGSHNKIIVKCLNCHRLIRREHRNRTRKHQCPVQVGSERKCFRCNEWKDLSHFNKNGATKVAKMCRQCYNSHPAVKNCERKRGAKSRETIENYIKKRIYSLRSSTKRRNIKFEIDEAFLLALWKHQNGRCYYTGIPMIGSMRRNGFQTWDTPSLDRQEPHLGYVKGNVVWCIFAINSFKQSLNPDDFEKVTRSIEWWWQQNDHSLCSER